MANILHLVRTVRTEDKGLFPDYTGDVYLEVKRDESNAVVVYDILVDAASLDTSLFNAAPIGSTLLNLHDGTRHYKTGATTWVTASTS